MSRDWWVKRHPPITGGASEKKSRRQPALRVLTIPLGQQDLRALFHVIKQAVYLQKLAGHLEKHTAGFNSINSGAFYCNNVATPR